MKYLLLLSVFIISASFFCAGQDDGDVTDDVPSNETRMARGPKGKAFLKVPERGGAIMLSTNDNFDEDNTVKVILKQIYQVGRRRGQGAGAAIGKLVGKKSEIGSFDRQNFNISAAENSTYPDTNIKVVTFSISKQTKKRIRNTVETTGTVTLTVYIFQEDGNITNGNETIPVRKGALKFNVELRDFNLCTSGDNDCDGDATAVDVAFTIVGLKGSQPKNATIRGRQGRIYKLGDNAAMEASEKVKVDGVWQDMPDGYPKFVGQGNAMTFVCRIPKFTSNGMYDPTVDLDAEDVEETDGGDGDGDGNNNNNNVDDNDDDDGAATLSHFSAIAMLVIAFAKFML